MQKSGALFATIVAIGATLFILRFYPGVVQGTTFNQGPRQVDITPQNGVAVSDNGGNANASDNSVAVAHGSGATSDASGHSTAVSGAEGNSQSTSIATNDSTVNGGV